MRTYCRALYSPAGGILIGKSHVAWILASRNLSPLRSPKVLVECFVVDLEV